MSRYERKDGYYKRAKSEGFRSRAAYKLQQLDQRHRLLRRGARVIDLGCAPGGWLQVAAGRVGRGGRVVGIDRLECEPLELANAEVLVGDIGAADTPERLRRALGGPADVVLSDMAPDTSGVGFADHVRSVELVRASAAVAAAVLRPGGQLCAKVFDGPELQDLVAALRQRFVKVRRVHPAASRKGSRELYLVATDFKPAPA